MAIASRKPRPGRFIPSPETKPTQSQFNRGQQELEALKPQAKIWVNKVNRDMLALTQPFARAAEMREGGAFRRQQEAQMRAELVGAAPSRTLDRSGFGLARALPDVGP
jgi:hypothetical protein